MQNSYIGYEQKAIESGNMIYYITWNHSLSNGNLKPISKVKIEKS